jgi:hypothetical protein
MGIKLNLTFVVVLALFQMLQNCSCKKGLGIDCSRTVYSFKLNIEVMPSVDSLNIGDTLWFKLNTPIQLSDLNSNTQINYGGAINLGSSINVRGLSPQREFTLEAVNKFNYSLKEGALLRQTNDFIEYNFSEKNEAFIFNLGLISKESGTYRVLFSNAANVFRNSDKCTKAGFTINIGNTNRNPYLNPFYTGGIYPEGGDYYFVVR